MEQEQDQEQTQAALYVAVDDGNKIVAMERSRRGDEGFRALLDEWNIPVVLITHDPADVDAFADSLAVYRNGMIRHVLDDYPARRASEPDALSLLAPLVEV